MLERDITKLTEKSRIKLVNKYTKNFIQHIRKEVRKAACEGHTVTSICHTSEIHCAEYCIKEAVRQSVIKYLVSQGFYVRKYEFGTLFDIDHYRVSWGEGIPEQQHIDELQSQIGEE